MEEENRSDGRFARLDAAATEIAEGLLIEEEDERLSVQERLAQETDERKTAILEAAATRAEDQERFALAEVLWEELLRLQRAAENRPGIASTLFYLAVNAHFVQDYGRYEQFTVEHLSIVHDIGHSHWISLTLNGLSNFWEEQGHPEPAILFAEESLALARGYAASKHLISQALYMLAKATITSGNTLTARDHLLEAIRLETEQDGDSPGFFSMLFFEMARVDFAEHSMARSATIMGQIGKIVTDFGGTHYLESLFEYQRLQEKLRTALGAEAYQVHYQYGYGMTLSQAVDYVSSGQLCFPSFTALQSAP